MNSIIVKILNFACSTGEFWEEKGRTPGCRIVIEVFGFDEDRAAQLQDLMDDIVPLYQVVRGEKQDDPIIKYTEEEFLKKCQDPVFKLASDIESDVFIGSADFAGLEKISDMLSIPAVKSLGSYIVPTDASCVEIKATTFSYVGNKEIALKDTMKPFDLGDKKLSTQDDLADSSDLEDAIKYSFAKTENLGKMSYHTLAYIDGEMLPMTGRYRWYGGLNWQVSPETAMVFNEVEEGSLKFQKIKDVVSYNTCEHILKHYVSFTGQEEFDYCEKCEKKL